MLFNCLIIGICAILLAVDFLEYKQLQDIGRKYIALEEWTEDRIFDLKRQNSTLEERLDGMRELLPKDGNGEIVRNRILLQQMNDEMEKSLKMEKQFNDGLSSIMNYGKPITEVK